MGRFLRRYSLDELPQLFCVLVGKMSLVGYRPLIPEETDCHKLRESMAVYRALPGLTGYAQLAGRDLVSAKNKAILDAFYARHISFSLDAWILLKTVRAVFSGRGNADAKG